MDPQKLIDLVRGVLIAVIVAVIALVLEYLVYRHLGESRVAIIIGVVIVPLALAQIALLVILPNSRFVCAERRVWSALISHVHRFCTAIRDWWNQYLARILVVVAITQLVLVLLWLGDHINFDSAIGENRLMYYPLTTFVRSVPAQEPQQEPSNYGVLAKGEDAAEVSSDLESFIAEGDGLLQSANADDLYIRWCNRGYQYLAATFAPPSGSTIPAEANSFNAACQVDLSAAIGVLEGLDLSLDAPPKILIDYPSNGAGIPATFDAYGRYHHKEKDRDLWLYVFDIQANWYNLRPIDVLVDEEWRASNAVAGAEYENGTPYQIGVISVDPADSEQLVAKQSELPSLPPSARHLTRITVYRIPNDASQPGATPSPTAARSS